MRSVGHRPASTTARRAVVASVAAVLALTLSAPAGAVPPSPGPGLAADLPTTWAPLAAPVAPSFDRTKTRGRVAARDLLQESGASSLALAVMSGQRVVWRETFGTTDAEGSRPTTSMRYGIGSVSKTVTTIALMHLVDQGRASLDAPLTDYLPDFTMADPAYRQITVRMLLNHSAGLPGSDYTNGLTTVPFLGYADQVLRAQATQRLKTTPGSMSVYCNDCFTLAGLVVERVSGVTYQQYVTENVFEPLGMRNSGFPTSPFAAGTWAPVVGDDGPEPQEFLNILASGGVWSTPTDMSRLAAMLVGGGTYRGERILTRESIAAMGEMQLATTLDPVVQQDWRYGLGWDTVENPGLAKVGVRAWTKGGDTVDYHAAFLVAPDERLAVTIQAAGRTVSSSALEALAQELMLRALVDRGDLARMPTRLDDTTGRRTQPSRADLNHLAGTYLAQGQAFRLTARDDRSLRFAVLTDGEWVGRPGRYVMRRDGAFWSEGKSIRTVRGWGRTFLVLRQPAGYGHYRVRFMLGERVSPGASTSPAWQSRTATVWLPVAELPTSLTWTLPPGTRLREVPGLPGYLWLDSNAIPFDARGSDLLAPMFLTVPGVMGRDLGDLVVVPRGGEEFLRVGPVVVRPKSGVPEISAGFPASVTIGAEGWAEWRTVATAGRVDVAGATDWRVYDEDLVPLSSGAGSVTRQHIPAGGYLVVFGSPGTTVAVSLAP